MDGIGDKITPVKTLAVLLGFIAVATSTVAAETPPSAPKPSPLLVDVRQNEIKSPDAWLKQRELIRNRWLDLIGGFPTNRQTLLAEVLGTEELPDFTRQHVKYQIEEGVFAEAYLLSPANARGKLPAVVVFHPTTAFQARGVAGLEAGYEEEKQQGPQLVRCGYIVLCPRNFIFDQGTNFAAFKKAAERVQERHSNWTGMARMTFDAFRAMDFLQSQPKVDSRRIGCIGHSLGAKVALYAAAFDERYRAAVFSEGGIGLTMSNWDAPWYLGSKLRNRRDGMDHHELLALIAPRAFLLLAGDSADNDKSREYVEAVASTYKLLDASQNLRLFNHHLGHRYPPEARRTAEEFLDLHLKL